MIIAVDPGANGAIAWYSGGLNWEIIGLRKMPETRGDTIAVFKEIIASTLPNDRIVCYHEKVANFIPDGGASQMMAFGRSAERCACIAETLGIPLIEILPKEWQKLLNLGSSERKSVPKAPRADKSMSKKEAKAAAAAWKAEHADEITAVKASNAKAKRDWKNKLKEEAQRRYPGIPGVTLYTADALLILAAAARYNMGEP